MESQTTPIIIEDLPLGRFGETIITEDFLRVFFAQVGCTIVEVTIRNSNTYGMPHAYAYVKFQTREMAERAVNELNYTKLENVPIRLCLADPETNKIRESDVGKLIIRNLPPEIEVCQLHNLFENFGEIISCNIPKYYNWADGTYHSRCYGIVQFRNPKSVGEACSCLKGAAINGVEITVEPFRRKTPEETFTKIFIKKLPKSIQTQEDLEALFSPFGEIQESCLPLDPNQKPKGFGFCEMKSHEDAVAAVNGLNGKEIEGKELICCRYMTKAELQLQKLRELEDEWKQFDERIKYSSRYLYVRGFNDDTTEEELLQKFKKFGNIESCEIMRDENGKSKGYGFILFENKKDARRCVGYSVSMLLSEKELYVRFSNDNEVDDKIGRAIM